MLKSRIKKGENVLGIWQRIPSSIVSEIIALGGIDFAALDMEHGALDFSDVREMVSAFKYSGIPVLLRIPGAEAAYVTKALDLGVDGIIVPQVETAAVAKRAVELSKFAPIGRRGVGGACAADDYGSQDVSRFIEIENERVLTIVQIETKQAVHNLEEIMSVQGIDLFYIGPFDLSQTLGVAGQLNHPHLVETIQLAIDKIGQRGFPIGMHGASDEFIRYWNRRGVTLFTIGMDNALFRQSVRDVVLRIRDATE